MEESSLVKISGYCDVKIS